MAFRGRWFLVAVLLAISSTNGFSHPKQLLLQSSQKTIWLSKPRQLQKEQEIGKIGRAANFRSPVHSALFILPRGGLTELVSIDPEVALTSVKALSELLFSVFLGYTASVKGILDPTAVQALSKISYNIFLPPLMLMNVAKASSLGSKALLPIPFFALVCIGASLGISRLIMKVMRIDPTTEKGRGFNAACSFQNAGILPLLFADALFRSHPDQTILTRAVAFISFSLITWSTLFFSLAYAMLTPNKQLDKQGGEDQVPGSLFSSARANLGKLFTPPVIACCMGLVIGGVPFLKNMLLAPGGAPLGNALSTLGRAYTPAALMVLAGSLAHSPPRPPGGSRELYTHVLGTSIGRFIMSPMVTAVMLGVCSKFSILPNDPVLWFVLLMQSCMPSAQNSVLILQVEGQQGAAGWMAQLLLVQYLVSIVPTSLLLTLFLQRLGLAGASVPVV